MMTYILKSKEETTRLNNQCLIKEFSLEDELKDFHPRPGSTVLDAGCGSGILGRYLSAHYPLVQVEGCDLSESSLRYARAEATHESLMYFQHDLVAEKFERKYDYIFNRLVAHHLNETSLTKMLTNFHDALTDKGEVIIIDPDGLFMNLGTQSPELLKLMRKVSDSFSGNLFIARLIPSIMSKVGFSQVSWDIHVMDFKGESRAQEVNQWNERFESGIEFYINLFGTEFEARRFFKLYLAEARREDVPMFYNKFIVRGLK